MKKVSKFVLMLCFVLSAALSYAHSATRTENKKGEGITIEVKEKTCHGGLDKSNAIFASINGHVLTVFFSDIERDSRLWGWTNTFLLGQFWVYMHSRRG